MPPSEDLQSARLRLADSRWRVIRGDRTLAPDQTWERGRRREEESLIIHETETPLSPLSQLHADVLAERMSRQELLPPRIRGFTSSDNADAGVGAGDDIDANTERGDGNGEHDVSENGEVEDAEEEEEEEEEEPFDPSAVGLKEISNLASFTVSSYKPGCGVKELRDDDSNKYWQYATTLSTTCLGSPSLTPAPDQTDLSLIASTFTSSNALRSGPCGST